ncbi:MAG: glutathione S-transferase family protein [Reyranella sp.]|nr:glutathione S-transferase family protein [Reyranella sp.]
MTPTITLFGFGLPEVSPFVTKTEVQLKMAGLTFTKERAGPDTSPKGQLPFISDGGKLIADSTFIRTHIEKTYGIDLDEGLDVRQRAEAWAIERLIENHLTGSMAYARWLLPENFAKGPAHFFDGAPENMREALRQEVLGAVTAGLKAQGVARHAPDEVVELGDRSLGALSTLLGDKPYLMGDRPVGVDATAFGALAGTLTPFFESELRRRAEGHANLVAYTARMMARYFPDHPWTTV